MSDALAVALALVAPADRPAQDAAELKARLLAESKREEASELDTLLRTGCGADFNNLIVVGAFDGEPHRYQCGRCGVEGTYRAPRYTLED